MRLITSLVGLALFLSPVVAEAKVKGCYERVYDRKTLRKFPKQKITSIRIQYGLNPKGNGAEEDYDRVYATFKGEKKNRSNIVECQLNSGKLECGGEGDGGLFNVEELPKGIRIINRFDMKFFDSDGNPKIAKPQDQQRYFTLFKISDGRCEG